MGGIPSATTEDFLSRGVGAEGRVGSKGGRVGRVELSSGSNGRAGCGG